MLDLRTLEEQVRRNRQDLDNAGQRLEQQVQLEVNRITTEVKLQLDAVTEDMRQLQRDATALANELQEQQRERADDAERALDRSLNALREQIDGQLAALQGAMFAELLQQVDAERQARNDQRNGDLQQLRSELSTVEKTLKSLVEVKASEALLARQALEEEQSDAVVQLQQEASEREEELRGELGAGLAQMRRRLTDAETLAREQVAAAERDAAEARGVQLTLAELAKEAKEAAEEARAEVAALKLATERASLDLATDLSTMRNALMGDIKEVEDALDEKVRLMSELQAEHDEDTKELSEEQERQAQRLDDLEATPPVVDEAAVAQLRSEIDDLKRQLEDQKRRLDAVERQANATEASLREGVLTDVAKLLTALESLNRESAASATRFAAIEASAIDDSRRVAALQQAVDDLRNRDAVTQDGIVRLEELVASTLAALRAQLAALEERADAADGERSANEAKADKALAETLSLSAKLEALEELMEDKLRLAGELQAELEEDVAELGKEQQQHDARISALEAQPATSEARLRALIQEVFGPRFEQLETQRAALAAEQANLSARLTDAERKAEEAKAAADEAKRLQEESGKLISELEAKRKNEQTVPRRACLAHPTPPRGTLALPPPAAAADALALSPALATPAAATPVAAAATPRRRDRRPRRRHPRSPR